MRNLTKLLALAVMVVAFASCGLSKKFKSKQAYELEAVEKRDSSELYSAASTTAVKEQSVDKGVIVTEREVTTVTEKGGKSKVTVKKGDLRHGDNYLKDSAGVVVKAILDTLNKTLTLEVNTPSERTTRTEKERITESKDNTTNREERKDQQQQKHVAVSGESRRSEDASSSVSESSPDRLAVFLSRFGWWIGLGVVVVFLAWWFFGVGRKRK